MAISKVIVNGEVLMDVTDTTATAPDVFQKYFYGADGVKTLGTGTGTAGTDGDELAYGVSGEDGNLVGYGVTGLMIIDSYGYGYAGYFLATEDANEGDENNGV